MLIEELKLKPISLAARKAMQQKVDELAKPVGGLGKLESMAVDLAGMQATTDLRTAKRCCLVFAADHGVEREGVSATPRKVTRVQAANMVLGKSTVATLAAANNCEVKVIDVGIDGDPEDERVINRKVMPHGTNDMLVEAAMSRTEALAALQVGYEMAEQSVVDEGTDILLVGELGIGNTTPSAAIIAVMFGVPVAQVVGRGSNISDERLLHKTAVIEQAIAKLKPDKEDPIDVLSKVGGLEIAAKAGAMLYAATHGVPLILDGFISYAAAVIAEGILPGTSKYLLASHASREVGTKLSLEHLQLQALLDLNLAVGEGSGAVLVLGLIDSMKAVLDNMNTLADLEVIFTR